MATSTQHKTVVGVFNSVHDAQAAVRDLESQGISRDEISIVANKNAVGYDSMDSADRDKTADVVADAGIGAAIGGVGGLLLSAVGAITIPVIGPILAAGPIAAALTGAGIGAAAGGLIGALTESGIPEEHAKHYAEGVRRGDVLVTVRSDERHVDNVCDVLDRHNAVDVDDRVQNWRSRGWSGFNNEEKPFDPDELRREREYYHPSSGTLTGREGIAVDRERAALHDDRDDLRPRIPSTEASNLAGDIGTSGIIGTTGMTGAGLGTPSTVHHDDRSLMDRMKDKARDLRDEARETSQDMRHDPWEDDRRTNVGNEVRETGHRMSDPADPGRRGGGFRDTVEELGRDTREAGRDTRDVLTGRTGQQPHDRLENRREAERDYRTGDLRDDARETGHRMTDSTDPGNPNRGARDYVEEAGRDLKEFGRDTKDALTGRTGRQPHDRMEDAREAERRRRSRVYDRF